MSTSAETSDVHIHLRARAQDRALIDRAAELTGSNRSQFILEASLRDAKSVLADQTGILASQQEFNSILAWMDARPTDQERDGMVRLAKAGMPRG